MARELQMEQAGLEEITDPKEHLDMLERLGQEVLRPALEHAAFGLERHVGRQDQNGEIRRWLHQRLDLREDLEAIQVRHREIEQDEVGPNRGVERQRLARVRRGRHGGVALALEQPLEEPHVGGLVVDDQDSGALEALRVHQALREAGSASSRSTRNCRTSSGLVR